MKKLGLMLLGLGYAGFGLSAPSSAADLHHFLKKDVGLQKFKQITVNYADHTEGLAYAADKGQCGPTGCALFILDKKEDQKNWQILGKFPAANLPIVLYGHKTLGYYDIGYNKSGKDALSPYIQRLTFTGAKYFPASDSFVPAHGRKGSVPVPSKDAACSLIGNAPGFVPCFEGVNKTNDDDINIDF